MIRHCNVVLLTAICIWPCATFAKPIDGRAASVLQVIKKILEQGPSEHHMSEEELTYILEASEVDSIDVRMAAAYALVFSDSENGNKALQTLIAGQHHSVAGVAGFSMIYKQAEVLKKPERLMLLSYWLGSSNQPWTRTLLASCLGDDFQKAATPMFLAALGPEKDPLVRAELLFQIVSYGDSSQLKLATALLEKEKESTAGAFTESVVFFLNAISQNPIDRESTTPIQGFLRDALKSRLQPTNLGPEKKK